MTHASAAGNPRPHATGSAISDEAPVDGVLKYFTGPADPGVSRLPRYLAHPQPRDERIRMSDMTGRVALITGASSGIGKATAELSSAEGAPAKRLSPAERAAAFHRGHAEAGPSDC